jgi:UDP-glucose 4-epimerase
LPLPKILLTGHKGYIGSHLLPKLPGNISTCDLVLGQDYRTLADHWDVVIHLAASTSVADPFPGKVLDNNAFGLLHFLHRNHVGRMIFASTGGAMYGNRRNASEEDACWEHLISAYAQSKYIAEHVIRELVPSHCILRFANVHGGIERPAGAHGHFAVDDPIILYGGEQTRDFIHIDKVCDAFLAALNSGVCGTFNIGSGVETRIADIAREFSYKRGVKIVRSALRPGEVEFASLNCSRAHAEGLL